MIKTSRFFAFALFLVPLAASAALYIEPRVLLVALSGTPSIGDLGAPIDKDLPRLAGSVAVGAELTPRVRLEIRYTAMEDLNVLKISPNWRVFPGDVLLPTLRKYDYAQRTDLLALAMPWQAVEGNGWSLLVVPILQAERARVELAEIVPVMGINFPPPLRVPFHRQTDESLRFAAEVALGYSINERITTTVHYNYSPLKNFDAHFFGTGVGVKF